VCGSEDKLQAVAPEWSTHSNTLHCNTLYHTAAHYNTVQHTTATHYNTSRSSSMAMLLRHATTQQHTVTQNAKRVASQCNTLQHNLNSALPQKPGSLQTSLDLTFSAACFWKQTITVPSKYLFPSFSLVFTRTLFSYLFCMYKNAVVKLGEQKKYVVQCGRANAEQNSNSRKLKNRM